RVPLHIWCACGVGKSQIVSQVANDLDYDFLDVRAVQLDPVDLRGLPRIKADQTEWVPPKFLPTTGKGILFLDELTSAPQMTQAGCYQLVLDRKLGEYVLPDGWVAHGVSIKEVFVLEECQAEHASIALNHRGRSRGNAQTAKPGVVLYYVPVNRPVLNCRSRAVASHHSEWLLGSVTMKNVENVDSVVFERLHVDVVAEIRFTTEV